jgi:hypothetical protein
MHLLEAMLRYGDARQDSYERLGDATDRHGALDVAQRAVPLLFGSAATGVFGEQ